MNFYNQYKCSAVLDFIEDGSTDIDMVYGNHNVNKTLESVTFLDIRDENLVSIPPNLEFFFTNLTGITIVNSKLQQLTADDLRPFYGLQLLRIVKNPLTTLRADTFRYNPKLMVIDLSSNKIMAVGKNLLLTLPYIRSVIFSDNSCVNENAEDAIRIMRLNLKLSKLCPFDDAIPNRTTSIDLSSV